MNQLEQNNHRALQQQTKLQAWLMLRSQPATGSGWLSCCCPHLCGDYKKGKEEEAER